MWQPVVNTKNTTVIEIVIVLVVRKLLVHGNKLMVNQ